MKHIITTWTYEEINDPKADRDALEAIVASLLDKNDVVEAAPIQQDKGSYKAKQHINVLLALSDIITWMGPLEKEGG